MYSPAAGAPKSSSLGYAVCADRTRTVSLDLPELDRQGASTTAVRDLRSPSKLLFSTCAKAAGILDLSRSMTVMAQSTCPG